MRSTVYNLRMFRGYTFLELLRVEFGDVVAVRRGLSGKHFFVARRGVNGVELFELFAHQSGASLILKYTANPLEMDTDCPADVIELLPDTTRKVLQNNYK
jgi:hypothetical protein